MVAVSERREGLVVDAGEERASVVGGGKQRTCRAASIRSQLGHTHLPPNMPPQKVVSTPYRLIDADPHVTRVVSYMRPSDYAVWGGSTAAAPAALYLWGEHLEITRTPMDTDRRIMCY